MTHHHHHDHGHSPSRAQNRRRLGWTLVLTAGYMLAEIIGGWWSDSLALLADAGHMFSDVAALGLSLLASWIAERPATPRHSYGYYRAEILAALANGAALVAVALFVFVEAFGRLREPHAVAGPVMLGVALGGLVVNLAGMALLHAGRAQSLNIHGAWLHLLTDALGSVAVLIAAAGVWWGGWPLADPLASIAIAALVVYSAWGLLQESIAVLMESTPSHLDVDDVRSALVSTPGVRAVHDLHIWAITGGMVSLSAHVVLDLDQSPRAVLAAMRARLHEQFGIAHTTIQVDEDGEECGAEHA